MLDEAGVQCATGSACSALSDEASHVIKALGFTDEQASATLRFTMGQSTTKEQIDIVVEQLKILINKLNNNS